MDALASWEQAFNILYYGAMIFIALFVVYLAFNMWRELRG